MQEGYKGKDDTSIGPFADKWLILSIMGAGRGKGKEQGQVVVNLAHYAAVHNEARQGFTVAVSDKKVSQSIGEVVLEVTIGCVLTNYPIYTLVLADHPGSVRPVVTRPAACTLHLQMPSAHTSMCCKLPICGIAVPPHRNQPVSTLQASMTSHMRGTCLMHGHCHAGARSGTRRRASSQ